MLKKTLGIIAGFIVWMLIWLSVDPIIQKLAPGIAPNKEMTNISTSLLLIVLAASFICSIAGGFTAVLISKEFPRTTLFLGILLLSVGIFVEISMWNLLPVWYHTAFLISLIPMTILGGKIEEFRAVK